MTPVAPPFSGVVVGDVLAAGRHPDAEKLSVCEVTTDGSIGCKSSAAPQTCAPDSKWRLRWLARSCRAASRSSAQSCAAWTRRACCVRRANSASAKSTTASWILPESLDVNRDLREALDLDDTVLEVNATPNRGDCMSVFGIARDYAAARERRYLNYHARRSPPPIKMCSRCGSRRRRLPAVRVPRDSRRQAAGSRPFWLRERLRRVGINSISPVVDVTNYVMIELGQPLHAYDLARLSGPITVRAAQAGRTDDPAR